MDQFCILSQIQRSSLAGAILSIFIQGPWLEKKMFKQMLEIIFTIVLLILSEIKFLGWLEGPFIILVFPCEPVSNRVSNLRVYFSRCNIKWIYIGPKLKFLGQLQVHLCLNNNIDHSGKTNFKLCLNFNGLPENAQNEVNLY